MTLIAIEGVARRYLTTSGAVDALRLVEPLHHQGQHLAVS